MSLLGDAVQAVVKPRRMNYSIYGNTDAFLHAHVFPNGELRERIASTLQELIVKAYGVFT